MKDRFRDAPPLRLKLTKAQCKRLEKAKPAGSGALVVGYARRHPWPDNESHTICAWFIEPESAHNALVGAGIMSAPAKKKRSKRAKTKKPKTMN